MARMVATKAALSIRVDALTDSDGKSEPTAPSIGVENRSKLESRLRALEYQSEGGNVRRFTDNGKKQQRFEMSGETKTYNDSADFVPTQRDDPKDIAAKIVKDVQDEKKKAKKEKKEKKKKTEDSDDDEMDVDGEKKEKKRKRRESEANAGEPMDEDPKPVGVCVIPLLYLRPFPLTFYRRKLKRRKRQGRRLRRRLRPKLLPLPLTPQRKRRRNPRIDLQRIFHCLYLVLTSNTSLVSLTHCLYRSDFCNEYRIVTILYNTAKTMWKVICLSIYQDGT